ncbi:P-loop containing nucleoside triphosphate hydrolase protein [Mycena rebaudengoi]|nr:P-loop containing nucleoside triphosphate hydrolase protein [Mycena rebaudengoi]
MRHADAVVISSTGSGKSLTWTLPLLARKEGISLVITPFTSLGLDGELSNNCDGLSSLFIYHEQNTQEDFELAAQGDMLVVYVCPEMLESPSFARLVHSKTWCGRLSAIYIDEAHLIHQTHHWRPSYSRLYQFRNIIGSEIPLICLSATCPKLYRDSLIIHAGCRASNLVKTIIYSSSMDLPTHVIDIIHSGLSARHQEICLEDFRNGKTSILLGSSKISAGMNFSGVHRVIQYKCRDLTIPDLDQRRGRGARGKDETAVGMIFVEPSMLPDNTSAGNTSGQDPGMMELIQSDECAEAIIQKHLENPHRIYRHDSYPCCNRCDPSLKPSREYQWIEVDPSPSTQTHQEKSTITQREAALSKLVEWRLQHWRSNWRTKWPSYGPKALISDSDLETLANRPTKLFSVEEMRKYTHIVHWFELSEPLFEAIQNIYRDLNMFQAVEELVVSEEPQPKRRRVSKQKPEVLSRGEMVMDFL